MRRVRPTTRRSKVAVALAVMLMIGLMAPAANANGVAPKPFSMTVSPSTTIAGTSMQFTLTIKNWSVKKSSVGRRHGPGSPRGHRCGRDCVAPSLSSGRP